MVMAPSRKYQIIIYVLLAGLLAFITVQFLPAALSVQNLGLKGIYRDGQLVVQRVHPGSPADQAHLQAGDAIIAIDGQPVQEWHRLYDTRLSQYLTSRAGWQNRPVSFQVQRLDKSMSVDIKLRQLSISESVSYYSVHFVLIIFLIVMIVFIMTSNPKDARAFLVAINFLALALWVSSDLPSWPEFMGALVPTYSLQTFRIRELVFIFSLQLVFSIFMHIVLVFPSQLLSKQNLQRILPLVYGLPSGAILLFMLFAVEQPVFDHMTAVAKFRLQIDTILLLIVSVLIIVSYRLQKSPLQKEQARWVVRSMIVVTLLHLVLWNLPKLILGEPFLSSYAWLWLSLILIPLALTVAIANHRIFGIRGLIRRRLAMLNTLLSRERSMVRRRDEVIRNLANEIQHLKDELRDYETVEQPLHPEVSVSDELLRLENDYPEIRRARETALLGASPVWSQIFRDAVLAARGDVPVVIVGESGTGKTEIAHTVFRLSDRVGAMYRQISCAQFEHADPAFALGKLFGIGTGHGLPNVAKDGQPGLLEECDGGVLFLDDFDRLPLNVQDLLLYPLEGKAFDPGIGTGPPRAVSVKFILATNRDPVLLVRRGELQGDVLARTGARITIPPLRERPEDIPLLVEHFLTLLSKEFDHVVETVSPKAMNLLVNFPYRQGNARELYAELRQAVGKASLEKDSVLRAGYLSNAMRSGFHKAFDRQVAADAGPGDLRNMTNVTAKSAGSSGPAEEVPRELAVLRANDFEIQPSERDLGLSHKSKTLSNYLRGLCIKALVENDWQPSRAARALASEHDEKVVIKLERKIERYVRSIKAHIEDGTETRLYANLPAHYHDALALAIQWTKSQIKTESAASAVRRDLSRN